MTVPFEENNIHTDIAEGRIYDASKINERSKNAGSQFPTFQRMVVLEVINDPTVVDERKMDYWESLYRIRNDRLSRSLTRNSIIAQKVLDGVSGTEPPMFLFPFFPSHLSLPVKPGEHVWVMFEHTNARQTEIGYWMCRITDPHYVDDVNHTHHPRVYERSFIPSLKEQADGDAEPTYELRNGITSVDNEGNRYTRGQTAFVPGDETIYESLVKETDAARLIQHEPVPRYKKRPADFALEGSNNTLIVMGTDRVGPVSTNKDDENLGAVPDIPPEDVKASAGMIDIVAGRGQTEATGGKVAKTKTLDGSDLYEEVGKSEGELVPNEGDPDLKNDRSRILVAQSTHVDKNFSIDEYNKKVLKTPLYQDDKNGEGATVLKSDKVRIIARSDVEVIVPSYEIVDGKLVEVADHSKWASIIVRSNGDIVFIPAETGVIKLGGDDADKAVLCTTINNKGAGGQVTASPIVDTMAGVQGASDGLNGTFAKKVLLKLWQKILTIRFLLALACLKMVSLLSKQKINLLMKFADFS